MIDYVLDISKCKFFSKKSQRIREFKIPLKTGIHYCDLDVVECDVPKDIYNELVDEDGCEFYPIGLNFREIPDDAILIKVNL